MGHVVYDGMYIIMYTSISFSKRTLQSLRSGRNYNRPLTLRNIEFILLSHYLRVYCSTNTITLYLF